MSDCFTGRLKEDVPPAIEAFGKVLADKPALKIIDFSDNAFSPAGATALSFFLANCTSLEELRLNNNGLGPEGGKIIANGLKENRRKSQAAGKASVLRRVTIGRNRLENGSASELAEAFSLHENLEDVALFQNGIRPEGITVLSQGLSKCLKLKSLDLQDNTFTSKGSKALAAAIPSWTELSRLNIGDCLLSDSGCKEIISKLISCPAASKLTVLNLQYAEMESETAEYLASNLSTFSSLEKLFLNGNCFAPEGKEVEKIKVALLPTTTLDELDDMDYDDEEEESDSDLSESESEESETEVKVEDIPSTPSPKPAVDEVADVTEIIGAMNIKKTAEMEPEPIEVETAEAEIVETETPIVQTPVIETEATEIVESVAEAVTEPVVEVTEEVTEEAAEEANEATSNIVDEEVTEDSSSTVNEDASNVVTEEAVAQEAEPVPADETMESSETVEAEAENKDE